MVDTLVAIRVNKKTYAKYKKFCKQNGFTIGKRIGNFMLEDLAGPSDDED